MGLQNQAMVMVHTQLGMDAVDDHDGSHYLMVVATANGKATVHWGVVEAHEQQCGGYSLVLLQVQL